MQSFEIGRLESLTGIQQRVCDGCTEALVSSMVVVVEVQTPSSMRLLGDGSEHS